jgi:hypothetical protein
MTNVSRKVMITSVFAASFLCGAKSQSQEPGWTGRIVKIGIDKETSDATPILARPCRPLHFYGNTVHRAHYRGNPFVMPRDFVDATYAFIYRR